MEVSPPVASGPAWKAVACRKCGSGPGVPCFRPRLGAPAQLLRCSPHVDRRRAAAPETPAAAAPDAEFDPLVFDLLRAAVNLARNEQIRTAARLRERMGQVYPSIQTSVVESALKLWSDYGQRTHRAEAEGGSGV